MSKRKQYNHCSVFFLFDFLFVNRADLEVVGIPLGFHFDSACRLGLEDMRLGANECVQCVLRIDNFALEHTNCMGSKMLCNG